MPQLGIHASVVLKNSLQLKRQLRHIQLEAVYIEEPRCNIVHHLSLPNKTFHSPKWLRERVGFKKKKKKHITYVETKLEAEIWDLWLAAPFLACFHSLITSQNP